MKYSAERMRGCHQAVAAAVGVNHFFFNPRPERRVEKAIAA
jgi:hypothetical protein